MDNNIIKALWLGVGVLFFIGVVSLGITLFNQGKDVMKGQGDDMENVRLSLKEAEFKPYDNESVTGADVYSCIKSFRNRAESFAIKVTTKKQTTVYLNDATITSESVTIGKKHSNLKIESDIKSARTETSKTYMNKSAVFDANIRRDKNGVISAIVFVQE